MAYATSAEVDGTRFRHSGCLWGSSPGTRLNADGEWDILSDTSGREKVAGARAYSKAYMETTSRTPDAHFSYSNRHRHLATAPAQLRCDCGGEVVRQTARHRVTAWAAACVVGDVEEGGVWQLWVVVGSAMAEKGRIAARDRTGPNNPWQNSHRF